MRPAGSRRRIAHNARQRARMQDPAIREEHNARHRARRQDPAIREEHNARQRERLQDPALLEEHNAQRRACWQVHLQESRESRATPNRPPTPKKAGSRRREISRMTSSRYYGQNNREMINARKRSWQRRWRQQNVWAATAACQSAAQRLLRHVLAANAEDAESLINRAVFSLPGGAPDWRSQNLTQAESCIQYDSQIFASS